MTDEKNDGVEDLSTTQNRANKVGC